MKKVQKEKEIEINQKTKELENLKLVDLKSLSFDQKKRMDQLNQELGIEDTTKPKKS